MLKIGQGRTVNDLAAGLKDENGRYLVLMHDGSTYEATCKPHQSITSFVITELKPVANEGRVPELGKFWVERIPDTE